MVDDPIKPSMSSMTRTKSTIKTQTNPNTSTLKTRNKSIIPSFNKTKDLDTKKTESKKPPKMISNTYNTKKNLPDDQTKKVKTYKDKENEYLNAIRGKDVVYDAENNCFIKRPEVRNFFN